MTAAQPTAGPSRGAPAFRPVAAFGLAAILMALGLPLLSAAGAEPEAPVSIGVVVMVFLAGLSEVQLEHRYAGQMTHVLVPSDAALVIGLALAGPAVLVTGRLLVLAAAEALRRRHPAKLVLNAAVCLAETGVGVVIYRAVLAGGNPASATGIAAAASAVAAATLIGLLVMAAVVRLHGRRPQSSVAAASLLLAGSGLVLGLAVVFGVSAVVG